MIHGIPLGTITVEVTRQCHRRCAFCYVAGLTEPGEGTGAPGGELPAAELVRLVGDLMCRTGCRNVQLSGGEPLLRPDLLEIIAGLRAAGARISMISDLAHLDAALARESVRLGVGPVQPTLLAGSAEGHDALRGRGAFGQVTRAMAVGSRAGLHITSSLVITRKNWQEAGRVAELAFGLGARTLVLCRFCPAGEAGPAYEALMPTAAQVVQAVELAAGVCGDVQLRLASAVTIPSCVWPVGVPRPAWVGVCSLMGPRTTVTVAPDGGLRSCTLSQRVVGNLRHEAWEVLAERFWVEELGPFRAAVPGACRGCAEWAHCLGGCRLSAQTVFGDLDHPDPLAPGPRSSRGTEPETGTLPK